MAEKALGNRGMMGRLMQKLFAGGQANNVISVAFQMADPDDGWTLVDEKTGQPIEVDDNGGSDVDGNGDFGDENGSDFDDVDGKGNGKDEGNGNRNRNADKSLEERIAKIEGLMTDNNLWGDVPPPQRNNETAANESSDPFEEILADARELDRPRLNLVREVCESGKKIGELVDSFLM